MSNADLIYQRALDRLAALGPAALSETERDVVALWYLEADVNNGGFERYYSRAGSDYATQVVATLERMGAAGKAAIVREANALFGTAGPPPHRRERLLALKLFAPEAQTKLCELEIRYYDDAVDIDELVERLKA